MYRAQKCELGNTLWREVSALARGRLGEWGIFRLSEPLALGKEVPIPSHLTTCKQK